MIGCQFLEKRSRERITSVVIGICLFSLVSCAKGGGGGATSARFASKAEPSKVLPSSLPSPIVPLGGVIVPPPNVALSPITRSGDSEFLIAGTCINGSGVILEGDDAQQLNCLTGDFSFTVSKVQDGHYHFLVRQEIAESSSSAVDLLWFRDTQAPAAPLISEPATNPFTANTDQVALVGSCETDATVTLSGDASDSKLCVGGRFGFTLEKASDGSLQVTLKQADGAGNVSSGTNFTWIRDSLAPPVPEITSPVGNPFYSNQPVLAIEGSCLTGNNVQIASGAVASEVTLPVGQLQQPCVAGKFSFSVQKDSDGPYTFALTEGDSAGNASAPVSLNWVLDRSAPAKPVIAAPSPLLVVSSGAALTISGSCEAGATVMLTGDAAQTTECIGAVFSMTVSKVLDGAYRFSVLQKDPAGNSSAAEEVLWTRDTTAPGAPVLTAPTVQPFVSNASVLSITGTCEANARVFLSGDDAQDVSCGDGIFSFSVAKSVDAPYHFSVAQRDRAGNSSAPVSLQWLRDTEKPLPVQLTSPSANPYLSGDSRLSLSGVCEAGATVHVSGDATASAPCSGSSFTVEVNESSDAVYHFTLNQTDAAGNTSGDLLFQWTRDTAIPPVPTIDSPAANPAVSNSASLTISGGCSSGNKVHLAGDDSQVQVCAESNFSFNLTPAGDGTYVYVLSQETPAGNLSAFVTVRWTRDTQTPPPVILKKPLLNPFTSGDTTLEIVGSCENGATVSISGATTGTASCNASEFGFTMTKDADGVYNVLIAQTDPAGNVSAAIDFEWVRDTTIPPSPTISAPVSSPYISNLSSLTVTGSCTSGFLVTLSGGSPQSQLCSADNTYSFLVNQTQDGSYPFSVVQTNTVTFFDSAPVSFIWIRDTAAPPAPVILTPAANPYTSSGNLTVSGTCEENAVVLLSGNGSQSRSCQGAGFAFTVNEDEDGTFEFTVIQTDRAGNASATAALTWVRDSVVPPTPSIVTPAVLPVWSNASSLAISGGCVSGNTVTLGGSVIPDEVATGSLSQVCVSSGYNFNVSKSSDGTFGFTLKQTSPSSIESGSISMQWIRDSVAPVTTITSAPPAANLSTMTSFSFATNDPDATLFCSLDGGPWSTCVSPQAYSGLGNGPHTFSVKAMDKAGNVELAPPAHSWSQELFQTVALYHFDSTAPLGDGSQYSEANRNPLTSTNTSLSDQAVFGEGRDLTQANSFLSAEPSATLALLSTRMTVEARVKLKNNPAAGVRYVIASRMGSAGQYGWEFGLRKQGSNVYLYFAGSLNGISTNEVRTPISTGYMSFHHFAVTWDRGSVKLYLDGVLKGSGTIGTAGSSILFNTNAALRIGANQTGSYLTGYMDEVRISQAVRWSSSFIVPIAPYASPAD